MKRIFLIVLDSCGVGYEPDADKFGDVGSDTLRRCATSAKFDMTNLVSMGLGNLDGIDYLPRCEAPKAALARLQERSMGKDTTIGHWEIAGVVSENPLPTYPNGFPKDVIDEFSRLTGRKVLCNLPYSGTDVIRDYGKEQVETGALIVYTSADSVFQIAAHEFDLAAGVDRHEADPLGQGEILHDLKALRWIMHQRGDEFRQPAEVMLERDGLIRFAAEQDLVAIHHVECRKGNGIHTAPALLLQHGSFHAIHGEQAHSDSEQDQRPGDEQYQFVLCGQDHRSSQGWLPRARARLAGSPRSGVLCLTSFSSGRNTRCAPGKETPLIFRSTPMHGKGRIQKHGLRNTLESIVPAHKCQTVMIPCPAFWNPVSVFSVLLFFLFPFAAGWLGKTGLRKSGDSRLSGTFRPYR